MAAELLKKKKIAIGISGASGAVYGIRLLEELAREGAETHLIISRWGEYTIERETSHRLETVKALASYCYEPDDMAAALSSGSFPVDAMAICPCSMKTLAGIAGGFSEDLLMRAADVCLKERRPLILAVRETPLSRIHIENMLKATDAGAIIMPPIPAFYMNPNTLDEVVTQSVYRIMDKLGIPAAGAKHWGSSD
ncbi:MAG: UbiX family flavin prenyltransferase [Clostridiales Family XIII bacterium]|jgi:4-hydroxy-3-polyprenylbenzoate decarboxylase|nr:UbiX family flavin prenyltransferase [Clostridiales Family XIII bacterium]